MDEKVTFATFNHSLAFNQLDIVPKRSQNFRAGRALNHSSQILPFKNKLIGSPKLREALRVSESHSKQD